MTSLLPWIAMLPFAIIVVLFFDFILVGVSLKTIIKELLTIVFIFCTLCSFTWGLSEVLK